MERVPVPDPTKRWTKLEVLTSARAFHGRAEWKAADSRAYKAAVRHDWLEEAVAHMPLLNTVWTMDALRESAGKFQTRGEWRAAAPSAYAAAHKKGLIDELCGHMTTRRKPVGYWTKERVIESARKYTSIQLWDAAETTARQRAVAHGWMAEATAHMSAQPLPIGPAIIHRFLMIHGIEYQSEYKFKDAPAVKSMPFDFYLPAFALLIEYQGRQHRDGWMRDPDSRKEIQRNDQIKREWVAAAGWNYLEVRAWEDKTEAAIIDRLKGVLRLINDARGARLVLHARELNAAQKRRLASGYVFDEQAVIEDASKYRSRSEWMKGSPNVYRFALRHGLDKVAAAHMPLLLEHGKWTKEAVFASAQQHETLADWRKAEQSAYVIAHRNGWLDEAAQHLRVERQRNDYWTRERVIEDAHRFKTNGEWRQASPGGRAAAIRHGCLVEATAHMTPGKRPNGYWTVARLVESARQFKTIEAWRKADPSAYTTACRLRCLAFATEHMRGRDGR